MNNCLVVVVNCLCNRISGTRAAESEEILPVPTCGSVWSRVGSETGGEGKEQEKRRADGQIYDSRQDSFLNWCPQFVHCYLTRFVQSLR